MCFYLSFGVHTTCRKGGNNMHEVGATVGMKTGFSALGPFGAKVTVEAICNG